MSKSRDEANNITRMRDAKLIRVALKRDPCRREFILRLRKSFHQFGSLTTAMREALRPTLIAGSSARM